MDTSEESRVISESEVKRIATQMGWKPPQEWKGLSTAETKVFWNLTKKPREYAQMIEAKLKERNS